MAGTLIRQELVNQNLQVMVVGEVVAIILNPYHLVGVVVEEEVKVNLNLTNHQMVEEGVVEVVTKNQNFLQMVVEVEAEVAIMNLY